MFKLNKLYLSLLLMFGVYSSRSQTAACPNWTKVDCNGVTRTLYDYLDSNQVVAMVFGMGCSSCTDAASFFSTLRSQYMISHPGRFKVFYLDFFAGNTCANNVTPIVGTNLDAGFDNCANELAAYTSASPMTYVVVVAGTSHETIYSVKKYIFDYSDSVGIKNSIDAFFAAVGIKEVTAATKQVVVFPNPTHDVVRITNTPSEIVSYCLNDTKGNILRQAHGIRAKELSLDVSAMDKGMYYLQVKYESGLPQNFKIVKQD